jgi:Na+/H+-dicarboxylate symporter
MSVLVVTVIAAKLLGIPISLFEVVLLIPPVVILGLESPGIPGGAGYFMSPVIASLLHVPNPALWVTTFVAVYSGLIPMFSTAGNTTDDGVVGAILEDRFQRASMQVTEWPLHNEAAFQEGET